MARHVSSSRLVSASFAAGGLLLLASTAQAQFTPPTGYGWDRGAANSTHFEWDVFTSVAGPNLPDAAMFPSPLPSGWSAPNAFDSAPGTFLTGAGNLYNIGMPLIMTAHVPNYSLGASHTTRVLLQARTLGTEIQPSSVLVNGVPPISTQELSREPLGGFGGAIVEVQFYFEVPGNAAAYTVRFDAAEASMSLDRLSIDTLAVGGCAVDQNGDGVVNSSDISAFITDWLTSVQTASLDADFNGDGVVNSSDISAFISAWLTAIQTGQC